MDSITTNVGTDWVSVIATITSGVLAAIATIVAVIYTNSQTNIRKRSMQRSDKSSLGRVSMSLSALPFYSLPLAT